MSVEAGLCEPESGWGGDTLIDLLGCSPAGSLSISVLSTLGAKGLGGAI